MFVGIINKMETQTFLKGYDSNGKPIFEKIDVDYKTVATTIGNNFLDFVRTLIPIIDDLDSDSVKLIKKLGGALQPMMDSLSKYVDIILKMADLTSFLSLKVMMKKEILSMERRRLTSN